MIRIMFEDRASFKAKFGEELLNKYLAIRNKISDPIWKDMDVVARDRTPEELEQYVDNFQSNTQKKKNQRIEGAKLLWTACGFKCYEVSTYDAMKQIGRGTTWCLAGNYDGHEDEGQYWFDKYQDDHNLSVYFVLVGHEDKYCILKNDYQELDGIFFDDGEGDEIYNADQSYRDEDALYKILKHDDQNHTLRKMGIYSIDDEIYENLDYEKIEELKKLSKAVGKEYLSYSNNLVKLTPEGLDNLIEECKNAILNNGVISLGKVGVYELYKCTSEIASNILMGGNLACDHPTRAFPAFIAMKDGDVEYIMERYRDVHTKDGKYLHFFDLPKDLMQRVVREYVENDTRLKHYEYEIERTMSDRCQNDIIPENLISLVMADSDWLFEIVHACNDKMFSPLDSLCGYLKDNLRKFIDEFNARGETWDDHPDWMLEILREEFDDKTIRNGVRVGIRWVSELAQHLSNVINNLTDEQYLHFIDGYIDENTAKSFVKEAK